MINFLHVPPFITEPHRTEQENHCSYPWQQGPICAAVGCCWWWGERWGRWSEKPNNTCFYHGLYWKHASLLLFFSWFFFRLYLFLQPLCAAPCLFLRGSSRLIHTTSPLLKSEMAAVWVIRSELFFCLHGDESYSQSDSLSFSATR